MRLENDKLICVVEGNCYELLTDPKKTGITMRLYDRLEVELKTPNTKKFKLKQHEKNQIRDFLIQNECIRHRKLCGYVESFPKLGYIRGTIYGIVLLRFQHVHKRESKRLAERELRAFKWDIRSEDRGSSFVLNPVRSDSVETQ